MGKEVGNGGWWLLAFPLVLHFISVILYKPMHWASISLQFLTLKMGQIVSPETLVSNLNQTPGNYPREENFNTMNHGESLTFNKSLTTLT
jgi:hypothetical protein